MQYILCSKYPLSSSRARRQHVPLTLTVHNFRGRLCHSAESPPLPQASFTHTPTHMHTHTYTHTLQPNLYTHPKQRGIHHFPSTSGAVLQKSGDADMKASQLEIKCLFCCTDKFMDQFLRGFASKFKPHNSV